MSRRFKKGELLAAIEREDIEKVLKISSAIPDYAKGNITQIVQMYKCCTLKTTPLTIAILHRNYHFCQLLVEDGNSLRGEGEQQLRPLSLALHFRDSNIAKLLIEMGADVNLLEYDRDTYPLFWAIHKSLPPEIIELIISAGFPVNALVERSKKMTAIHCAVMENNIEAIKTLLKYPVDLNVVNISGETALCIAVGKNVPEIVKLLVEKGASLHNRNASLCPLFLAIRLDNLKMVDLLLNLGADIQEGWVHKEIVPPLQFALNYMNVDITMLLIGRGANIKARQRESLETALHVATCMIGYPWKLTTLEAKQVKIVKILIDKGADVNAKDLEGKTPLDNAMLAKNIELCKVLLREGADVIGRGPTKSTYRFEYIGHWSMFKCPELIRLCLERGGDFNFRDEYGLSPYLGVKAKHNPDMIRVFWQHGCPYDQPELIPGKMKEIYLYEPNLRDKAIFTAQADFMDGIKNNRIELVVSALERGAEPKGCSMNIPSTLHFVAFKGNHNIAKVLLENGVAVNKLNKKGQSPLCNAVQKNNFETCKILLQYGACFDYSCCKLLKNKSKLLVEEKDPLQLLFKKVYKSFILAKQGNHKLLEILHRHNSKDKEIVCVLMNCVSRTGLTMLGTALKHGHVDLAEDLMQFRVKNLYNVL